MSVKNIKYPPNIRKIGFQESLGTDQEYSGITCSGILGATIAVGELCYLANADDRWEKTDADAEATAGDVMLGICLIAGDDGDTTKLLLWGFYRDDTAFNFPSGGDALYVSTTAGDITATAPSGSGDIVRVVGYAHDDADTIFFCPGTSWVEIT
jgi:hypothetical protein